MTERILLSSLGTAPREVEYRLGQNTWRARSAPVALLRDLAHAGQPLPRVVLVLTPQAETTALPDFVDDLRRYDLGIEPTVVPMRQALPPDAAALGNLLHEIGEQIRTDNASVILDITHGLRHIPFLFYALALYLSGLRDVQVEHVYYGAAEVPDDAKPLLDFAPLVTLPEWFYAVRRFRQSGDAIAFAALVRELAQDAHRLARNRNNDGQLHTRASKIEQLSQELDRYTFAYDAGLPLELGRASSSLQMRCEVARLHVEEQHVPLSDHLLNIVAAAAGRVALSTNVSHKGEWKLNVTLDEKELLRQAGIIERCWQRQQYATLVELLREWVVSWLLWKQHGGEASGTDWLNRGARQRCERRLGALAELMRQRLCAHFGLSADQQRLGDFWAQLTDLRNAIAHCGMRKEEVAKDDVESRLARDGTNASTIYGFWKQLCEDRVDPPILGGGAGQLLISPLGNSPGALYSAMVSLRHDGYVIDRCLVVCSPQSRKFLEEACRQAGYMGLVEAIVLQDPHGGVSEYRSYGSLDALADPVRRLLWEADSLLGNITGGTTLMALVVEQLLALARQLDRPTARFGLIDRRPPEEQRCNLWVAGELFRIGDWSAVDGAAPSDSVAGEPG